ncbi:MAG: pilus (MSHA type) biogenesis protein MshL [Chromatiales bacterium]|nr:pilus (MSHA type) biogenesis protein MshL [Chromatiales bacterium]
MMNTSRRQAIYSITAGVCLLLVGCAQNETRQSALRNQMQGAFELPASGGVTPPPAEVSAALLPPLQLQLPGVDASATEVRFDVKVRNLGARDFFLGLVDGTPYNMVLHPKLGGTISLDLKNTTVPETMDVVRSVLGYDYKLKGNTVQVFPNTIHTRLFKVNYLSAKRTGQSLTTSKTGQITNGDGSGDGASNSSTIVTDSNADFWEELKHSLQMLVGTDNGRRISINTQTGMVMVRGEPSEMRIVEEYLQESQLALHRQVILEARILEVTLSDGFQSGINWAALSNNVGESAHLGLRASNSGTGALSSLADTTTPAFSNSSIASSYGGPFTLGLFTQDFTTFIDLLKTQGDVQVLSSPRVSTINNQKAVIKVGNDEFFVTNIDTQSSAATAGATTQVSVDLDPFFSGVALDVIPQISAEGDIVLHVHPAVSEVREQTKTVSTTFGTLSMPLAASNIRESDTVIRAANQQVVVIGGLMQNSTEDERSGIPLLSDIPVLGGLFRYTKKANRKSELVILLKPTVIDAQGYAWQQQLQHSSQRFGTMQGI